ncbi:MULTISPECIES: tripartite tricarboxylate transporter substrate binding protein [Achromobacter]|uniref:Tripartite tricarboxylate transporter substrate binding protein n=1 Tax=Achromobacter spanius TaxID=217203 RepID=A0ABY8GRC7_9BURK|nr:MULTISPECIES: tripartite tricarboxylate transporter substrate binding protein [Achromobacter]WAI83565.1 tripartite tricarboxylate transporter substrate binding protein [Achromobacter spanius]WEX93649.1 tripartite tricarboxylate transporter substrate binding protein [Achromobacter sp. SS2-2022]WFP07190.1 tripartite tricarboxylate transporter substrate binding protein [Achromobacter spanius]
MKNLLRLCLALCAVLPLASCGNSPSGDAATDASYPAHPITIVVTFPPGGGTDLLARRIGASLQEQLGQPVIVENRPGASGNIGARIVAEAPPDGYTVLMVNSSFAINPGVYRNLDFSPKQDFAAVINVAFVPSVFVVPAASPLQTLGDALAVAVPGKPLPFASCGNGTPQHLAGEMLARSSGAVLQQVPYKGCGPALKDVTAGQVAMGIVTASSAAPLIAAGKLRALAVTSPARSPLMPTVPTVAEQGIAGYALDQWHGLLAPAATPRAVVDKLNAAVTKIVRRPEMQAALREQGFTPASSTPKEFQSMINADIDRYTALTASIGLRAD